MTIRRGEDWGRPGRPPVDLVWFDDDASAAEAYARGAREIGLRGGDLARTLGVAPGTGGESSSHHSAVSFPIDVIALSTSDGRRTIALAHVVTRDRRWGWWRGRIVVAMNAQFIGRWDVAPRGHPNDGRIELFDVDAGLSWRQRILAARRLPTGAHVPHPAIRTRSLSHASIPVLASATVEVDGVRWNTPSFGSTSSSAEPTITLDVIPDALVVWIPGVR